MSDVLSPVSSVGHGTAGREISVGGQGGSFVAQPKGAETAIAVRPVDPARDARDARMDRQRDLPVGPAPTFKINVLQDMRADQREGKRNPRAVSDAENSEAGDRGQSKNSGPCTEAENCLTLYRSAEAKESGDQTLNRKV